MKNEKLWLENKTGLNNAHVYGMSSGLGASKDDLPTDIPAGSTCFDYTTKELFTYDGVAWN